MEGRTEERKHRQGKTYREKKEEKNTEGWKDGRKNGRTDRG